MTSSSARSIPSAAVAASTPAIGMTFSMQANDPERVVSSPPPQNNTVDLTEEDEEANDPDDAEGTVSSSQSSSTSGSSSGSSSELAASGTFSDSSIEGNPGEYYGGYGECFICGRRGHWAPGCPFN